METYQNYKGYGISYSSITGNTVVDKWGIPLRIFKQLGESKGLEAAQKYIDSQLSNS